jgi:3'-phosphoadenosine 5'-phosphosulfate sulfotransferase (PAPS reductase)/FAD synthetase
MSRVICTLSGGKASAWCADWALKNYPKEQVILYFNDTKWEHEDLYRFLNDLSRYFDKEIFYDSDGKNPEQLFYKHHAIANNRMPFCSHELKAKRLQRFYQDGDIIIFGISSDEAHRAKRIAEVYAGIADKTKRYPTLRFPLISENVTREQVDQFIRDAGIDEPVLYKMGFTHNNCSGGCVRA